MLRATARVRAFPPLLLYGPASRRGRARECDERTTGRLAGPRSRCGAQPGRAYQLRRRGVAAGAGAGDPGEDVGPEGVEKLVQYIGNADCVTLSLHIVLHHIILYYVILYYIV